MLPFFSRCHDFGVCPSSNKPRIKTSHVVARMEKTMSPESFLGISNEKRQGYFTRFSQHIAQTNKSTNHVRSYFPTNHNRTKWEEFFHLRGMFSSRPGGRGSPHAQAQAKERIRAENPFDLLAGSHLGDCRVALFDFQICLFGAHRGDCRLSVAGVWVRLRGLHSRWVLLLLAPYSLNNNICSTTIIIIIPFSEPSLRRRRRYGLVAVLDNWRHLFCSHRVGGQHLAIGRSRRLLVQGYHILLLLALLPQNQWESSHWRKHYAKIFGSKNASLPSQNDKRH